MPGFPTPNLNLTVPTVGGDKNNWGFELNANLSILDSAISAAAANPVSTSVNLAFGPNFITVYLFTTGASNLTGTLPAAAAANLGRIFVIVKVDSGAGLVTVSGTIGGGSNYVLVNQNQFVWVMSNGVSWTIIGSN